MKDQLNLNRLAFFAAVVETGSFTAAAERLNVGKAVVSHHVSSLEAELAVSLIVRTTRRLTVTEQGRRFYERCCALLRDAEGAYEEAMQAAEMPAGHLRLTAPIDYGTAVVAPAIASYLQLYPSMTISAAFDDDQVDLLEHDLDISIRVGWLADSSNQARRLGVFDQQLVCSPALLARHHAGPEPIRPEAVQKLPWISNNALRHPLSWTFSGSGGESVPIEGRGVASADKTPTAHAFALAGIGLTVLPDFLVTSDIASGRLVRLLPEWSLPAGGIHAVFPAARFRPAKVRAFMEILVECERQRSEASKKIPDAGRI